MTDSSAPKSVNPIRRVLSAVLIFQLGLGALLFWDDLQNGLQMPSFAPRAPALTEQVRPGDQTRRFRPDRAPPSGQPMPSSPLPDRLVLTSLEAGASVLLEGTIDAGDATRMIKELDALPDLPQTVYLNSTGGSVADALELGRHLHYTGVNTALRSGDICYSACPYLLAAGHTRDIPEDASVGVHQHYFGESTLLPAFVAVENIQRGQSEVMGYLSDMGIDPLVMRHALATPPDQIYILLPQELQRYRFIAETTDN